MFVGWLVECVRDCCACASCFVFCFVGRLVVWLVVNLVCVGVVLCVC